MAKAAQFASKLGLIAATVGSAVGLGNIWRFPAEAQANGGAAFVIIYIICVFLLGIPVMLAEFSIGRAGRSDAVGAFKNLGAGKGWWAVGALAILASYLILWFYMVVAGWTFEYLMQSITGALYEPIAGITDEDSLFSAKMHTYIQTAAGPLVNTFIVLALNLVILLFGVQKGIERMSTILMPLLFVLLAVFCVVSLTLPGAADGVAFFLHPDFSKITPAVVLNALGQSFFSLSLGMGILITYASYFPADTKLPRTAMTVSVLDLLVAIMMGLIIFPAVTTFGLENHTLEGAALVFITLPEVFTRMPGTQLWSILFFLLLLVAALTSTLSIAEVSVKFVQDRFKMRRAAACAIVLCPLFLTSGVTALSQGPLSHITICGMTIFDFLDFVATDIFLPLGSIFLCVYMGWFAPAGLLTGQLDNSNGGKPRLISRIIALNVRYVAPVLIALVFITNLL
nr:sodium-dependent transporter [Bacteroides sp.]